MPPEWPVFQQSARGTLKDLLGAFASSRATARLDLNRLATRLSLVKLAFRLLPYIYLILAALVLMSIVSILIGMNAAIQESAQQTPNPRQVVHRLFCS